MMKTFPGFHIIPVDACNFHAIIKNCLFRNGEVLVVNCKEDDREGNKVGYIEDLERSYGANR